LKKINFENFDLQNISNSYEYYKTKVYIKIKGEGDVDFLEGNMQSDLIGEIFRSEILFQKFESLMAKKVALLQSVYVTMPSLDILNSTLTFNKENPMFAPLSKLIDLTLQGMHMKTEEIRNDEMLHKFTKIVYEKIRGFKRGYSMLIYNSEEISTQRELFQSKHEKMMRMKLDQKDVRTIELETIEMEKRIKELGKENTQIKENLVYESQILKKEMDMVLYEMCETYSINQREGYRRVYEKCMYEKNHGQTSDNYH